MPDETPVRQWVLSLPHRVRFLLARSPKPCREVRGIFIRAVQSIYVRRARDHGVDAGRDIHFHALVIDGIYNGFAASARLAFHPAEHLRNRDVDWLARHVRALIEGHLRRNGQATLFGERLATPPQPNKKLCSDIDGYSLHAAIRCGAGQTARL